MRMNETTQRLKDEKLAKVNRLKFKIVLNFSLAILIGLFLGGSNLVSAQNHYLVDRDDDLNAASTCSSFDLNDCNFKGALQRANNDGTDSIIEFDLPSNLAQAINTISGWTIEDDGTLLITSDEMVGNGDNRRVRLGGSFIVRVFSVSEGANVTFQNVMIADGEFSSPNDGAAIDNFQGTVTIDRCFLFNNEATDDGGAVKNTSGATMTIMNSMFSSNTATNRGGAIFNEGTMTITDTTFSNNGATQPSRGGAIFNDGTLTVTDSTFDNNESQTEGGAINNQGTATITRSTLKNNSAAQHGGGISNNGMLTIENSTISGNQAQRFAGGIDTLPNSTTNLESVTIANNVADGNSDGNGFGGGINIDADGIINAKNSLIAKNIDNSPGFHDILNSGTFNSQGYNLIGNSTGANITGNTTGNILDVDPLITPLKNNGGVTETHAIAPASPAVDQGNRIENFDQRNLPDYDFPNVPNALNLTDIGAFERQANDKIARFDFDGDLKTDVSIFRPGPNPAQWWLLRSSDGGNNAVSFGLGSDTPVPADFTGDGKTDFAFFRASSNEWFVLRSEDQSFFSFPFGASGDIPAPGDFDGDGKADATVYRPSTGTWFINRSSDGNTDIIGFGAAEDKPVVADYDGDGMDDVAIYRPSVSQWWINRSTDGVLVFQFGQTGDKTVHGDYTGDGKADVAFWRPASGEWFVIRSEDQSFFSFPFGASGDIPVPGDYDGDGQQDAAVFRPSTTTWFINGSTSGTQILGFGATTDIPLANSFVTE